MDWKYFSHQMNPSPAEIGAPYKVPNTFHTGISTQAGTIPYLKKKWTWAYDLTLESTTHLVLQI